MLLIKFIIMAVALALGGYGAYGAYQQQITIYTGGRNLDQALLHASGLTASFLGLALIFLGGAIFCFIAASISRHPLRLERWEIAAKWQLLLMGLSLLLVVLQLLLIAY